MPSAGQGRSGVLASQMWTCESTMMRRARWASAGPDGCDAAARPAPAARVVVRTSRRENMDTFLLLRHSALACPGIVAALRARRDDNRLISSGQRLERRFSKAPGRADRP